MVNFIGHRNTRNLGLTVMSQGVKAPATKHEDLTLIRHPDSRRETTPTKLARIAIGAVVYTRFPTSPKVNLDVEI